MTEIDPGLPDGPTEDSPEPEDPHALVSDAATAAPELTPRGFKPTKTSIRALQKAVGIRASGDFDAETQIALRRVPSFPGESRKGDTGNASRAWQQLFGLPTSGVHDDGLDEALREFQEEKDVGEAGVGDVETWAAFHTAR